MQVTQRLAVRLALVVGLLAGSCSSTSVDDGAESAAVNAVAATTSTAAPLGASAGDSPGVLRVDRSPDADAAGDAAQDTAGDAAGASGGSTTTTSPGTATSAGPAASEDTTTSADPSTTTAATTAPTTATTSAADQAASTSAAPSDQTAPAPTTATTASTSGAGEYFATVAVGTALPSGSDCAAMVNARSTGQEVRSENAAANQRTVNLSVSVDGADGAWNSANSLRVTGNFTGTTEDILRWGACKWGFDEDVTRARAVTESSWSINTEGDRTESAGLCQTMGLNPPCNQSYGLLQVKGSVHEGTYPASKQATAFGVDYAMAWLRACYDGAMGWLGPDYSAGDEWGCVGAWFSGLWKDGGATDYIGVVRGHLNGRTWEQY